MKFMFAVLVVTLALPAGALAAPADSRSESQHLGASDRHAWSQLVVHARGTDVAAPDQQASTAPETISVSAPAPSAHSFDYGAAGIGAAVAIVLITAAFGLGLGLRRRNARQPSVVTG
jgi:hypothetical protein